MAARGEIFWPPTGRIVSAYGEVLMAADIILELRCAKCARDMAPEAASVVEFQDRENLVSWRGQAAVVDALVDRLCAHAGNNGRGEEQTCYRPGNYPPTKVLQGHHCTVQVFT